MAQRYCVGQYSAALLMDAARHTQDSVDFWRLGPLPHFEPGK